MKKNLLAAVVIALASLSAQAADIVDTAVASGNFKTLVTAIKAAGVVDTLKGPGPFIGADVPASNGVIHAIDTVLMPK